MFSKSESILVMDSTLFADPKGDICGMGSIGGEIISSFSSLLIFINSSNTISIDSELKFVEKFLEMILLFLVDPHQFHLLGFPRFAHEKINKIEIDILTRFPNHHLVSQRKALF